MIFDSFRYRELPKIERPVVRTLTSDHFIKKSAIGQYFASLHCIVCGCITTDSICADCCIKQDIVAVKLSSHIHISEQKCKHLSQVQYCIVCFLSGYNFIVVPKLLW